jgi:teichuronic acid biosynthesis glycosyltransferase TuaC
MKMGAKRFSQRWSGFGEADASSHRFGQEVGGGGAPHAGLMLGQDFGPDAGRGAGQHERIASGAIQSPRSCARASRDATLVRVLVVTKIFPNAAEPLSAPFNRQQFGALARRKGVELDVLATIPWFPGAGLLSRWSSAGRLAAVPPHEIIDGIEVRHPRTLFLPRMAHGLWGPLYTASVAPAAARYRDAVDVVLGSWAYPDGIAAVAIAAMLGVPAVVKLHGSDINVISKLPGPRRLMQWLLPRAARVVAVSRPLAEEVADLGVPRERIAIVMNGVDGELFHPRDRQAARRQLGLPAEGPLLLYVGNLKETKGILDLATTFERVAAEQPAVRLAIVGGGEQKAAFDALAARLPGRVVVAGPRPLAEIPTWMAACDVLTLPSWNEGTPNVLLEALACGRRVVATAVGGVPDVVTDSRLGELVPARDREALASALGRAVATPYDADEVARLGARGGWDASAAALHAVLTAAVAEHASVPWGQPVAHVSP